MVRLILTSSSRREPDHPASSWAPVAWALLSNVWLACTPKFFSMQVMSRKVQPTYTPEEVKAAFKVFEAPNSGLQVGPCPLSPADSASSPQPPPSGAHGCVVAHTQPGHVKTTAIERALTTYGTEKLTLEEAQDLLSQVRRLGSRPARGVSPG